MDPRHLPGNFQAPQAPLDASAPSTAASAFNGNHGDVAPKKRRTSATTSRGVANLTPEQLAKKRANDREAQRAIRERTKTQIESLEKRIRDLSNQQPHQELQAALRQKQLAEAENVQIKKTLNAALALLQPLLRDPRGPAFGSSETHLRKVDKMHLRPVQSVSSQFSDTASVGSHASASPTFGVPSPAQQHSSPLAMTRSYTSQGPAYPPGPASWDRQQNTLTHGLNINTSGERLNLGFLLDGQDSRRAGSSPDHTHRVPPFPRLSTNLQPSAVQTPKPPSGFEPPLSAHAVPIRNIPPTCPFDSILLDFLAERRARAAEGASPTDLVGPPYPSFSSLLTPERSIYAHPLSKVVTDILSKFPDVSELPEQVAVLYIMFLIMRWQIYPTQENYDRLPDWVTPRPSQLFTPHPVWIDHLPWPRMRDKMVHLYVDITLDDWFIPYTTTLSLNWNYEPSDTLLKMPAIASGSGPSEDDFSINPVFERHLRDISNWTLGPAFEKAFPQLADTCKIRRDERRRG
ncbi:MAG: hypothetical protein Q9201_006290 [Fulgogasparrea decipioides]